MELDERIEILIQSAELAQRGGVLTFDDAVVVKHAIDVCKSKKGNVNEAIDTLIKLANVCQGRGVYTLRDAYYIYLATEPKEE